MTLSVACVVPGCGEVRMEEVMEVIRDPIDIYKERIPEHEELQKDEEEREEEER